METKVYKNVQTRIVQNHRRDSQSKMTFVIAHTVVKCLSMCAKGKTVMKF